MPLLFLVSTFHNHQTVVSKKHQEKEKMYHFRGNLDLNVKEKTFFNKSKESSKSKWEDSGVCFDSGLSIDGINQAGYHELDENDFKEKPSDLQNVQLKDSLVNFSSFQNPFSQDIEGDT